MTNKQYQIENWEFVDEIETSFSNWFHSNHTEYSFKSEHFYGDCAIEDPKTREDLMKKWVYAAFYGGFRVGRCAKMEKEVNED
jgi:hypothetical protein